MTTILKAAQSRRTFLRGAGVTMLLPWLESIPAWGGTAAQGRGTLLPKRLAVIFMANGINPNNWWAKGSGESMELGPSLEPLLPFRQRLNFIGGLFNEAATNVGIHPGQTGNLLSGARLTRGPEIRGGISFDQVLANRLGESSVQPSLVLGCEQPTTGYHETNFSMAYGSHISWASATSPVPMEVYPSLAFDSLFENRGAQRTRSILDRVIEQAADLRRQASTSDQKKLDEYLTSVREVERRIDRVRESANQAGKGTRPGQPGFTLQRPDNGLPQDIREHMRLMADILALAFQTNKTSVATLLLCRDISGMFYPFLPVTEAHHLLSHNDTSKEFTLVNQYYTGQLAYLAQRLQSMAEGDGTVLDNSCLLFMSNMWSGSRHDSTRVPVLTLGSLGGTLQSGRVLDYYDRPADTRRLCSLYLSLMDRMGVELPSFGDADERLAGI
ncbi:MAG TPA: DUF1552 domain-containing protein [Vicinamibacterales bacterium]|nr:DUF1552 domain-containing protein [Vicinamibacterales bacterium]